MLIATLVAEGSLDMSTVQEAAHQIALAGGTLTGISWLQEGDAADIDFGWATELSARELAYLADALTAVGPKLDVFVQPHLDRRRRLLVADMDSTMITVECIDELADYVGLKPEVAAVTERAMRGEIDFAQALRDRVALLAGLSEATVAECLHERVKPMGGARQLVATFRAAGGRAVLVSGGFTHFTESVAAQLGFDRAVANRLVVQGGLLTGEVETPIVDAETKRAVLLAELGDRPASVSIAIGDGANDIPMIEAAGLGAAFHAKPRTEAAADACVRHGDLSVLLYAMGFTRSEWAT